MNKHPIGKTMADEKNTRRDVMCRVYMNCSTSGLSSQRILYVCKDHLGQDWVRRAHVSRECLSWSPALIDAATKYCDFCRPQRTQRAQRSSGLLGSQYLIAEAIMARESARACAPTACGARRI